MIGLVDLARALRRNPGIQVENLIVAERVDSTNTLARRLFDGRLDRLGPRPARPWSWRSSRPPGAGARAESG